MAPDPGGTAGQAARTAVVALLAAAVVVIGIVILSSGSEGHRVVVVADSAPGMIKDLKIRAAGRNVGKIESAEVTKDKKARLELRIEDDAWPIYRDAKLDLRLAGTIRFTDRYLDLDRGTPQSGRIAEDATLPKGAFGVPVEFDSALNTFDTRTRANFRRLFDEGGQAFLGTDDELRDALKRAPPAVREVHDVVAEVNSDRESLHTLLRSADAVVHAINVADPGIAELVSGAGTTFDAVASENVALRRLIERLPGTLDAARSSLARADGTVRTLGTLSVEFREPARILKRFVPFASKAFVNIGSFLPDTNDALRTLWRATPSVRSLLTQVSAVMPQVESISKQADTQVHCIRPFAPDIASVVQNFGNQIFSRTDKDHYVRAVVGPYPIPSDTPSNTAQVVSALPNSKFVFPSPPGGTAGQPWFIPECDMGPETYDPAKDPESNFSSPQYPKEYVDRFDPSRGDTGISRPPS